MSRNAPTFGLLTFCLAAGCNLAPKYTRPSTPGADGFREAAPPGDKVMDGWKVAQPQDDRIRGKWWEMFGDPQLNQLEEQVDGSNQTLAQSFANYKGARALVVEARAQLFPTLSISPSVSRQRSTGSFSRSSGSATVRASGTVTAYQLPADASWQADLWGQVRNTIEAQANQAQSTAAQLENTRLSLHAQLALYYFQLRSQDGLRRLYDQTVAAYQKDLDLVKIRKEGGVASDLDVAQADTQLKSAIAAATDLLVNRSLYEHAIAVLVGKSASTFSLPVAPLPVSANPPAIPVGVPSQLLERRPDIASAERLVAEANANIGVYRAAYFPTLTLSGSTGFSSTALSTLFSTTSFFWSLGASLSQILFDGGKRRGQLAYAWATYEGNVASYRGTVLTAFQQVEDELAALRILSEERKEQDDAVRAAQDALTRAEDRYKFGVDSYLNVITAQTTLLTNQRSAVTVHLAQMNAAVQLIEALGGGWDASQLPSDKDVRGLLSDASSPAHPNAK